jgi:hypothetical protein
MNVIGSTIVLPSLNPAGSFRSYIDGLFFRGVAEHPSTGIWTVGLGSFEVMFAYEVDTSFIAKSPGKYFTFGFWVDDIQTYYKNVQAAAIVTIERALDFYPSELWQFTILDLNGYRIGFNQRKDVA